MNKLERDLLETVKASLEESTVTDWEQGDIDDYFNHATKMRLTIKSAVGVMDTLIKQPTNEKE